MRSRTFLPSALFLFLAAMLVPATTQAQDEVEKLYKTKCQACHAADGSGDTPAGKKTGARDFRSEEVQKHTDAELVEVTAKGKGKMPAYAKSLKEEQIKALVAYVRILGKKK